MMFATISIIAAIFAGGSQAVENPVSSLADDICRSDRVEVISFVEAIAAPEKIHYKKKLEYTLKNQKTIQRLASLVRATTDASKRKTSKGVVTGQLIFVMIRGYANDSDKILFQAQVYGNTLMFDRDNARYWVELSKTTGSDKRSELYKRLANMDFNFDDEGAPADE